MFSPVTKSEIFCGSPIWGFEDIKLKVLSVSFSPCQRIKKESTEPRSLSTRPPRRTIEQHKVGAPISGNILPSAASIVQESFDSGWRFVEKQNLTLHVYQIVRLAITGR